MTAVGPVPGRLDRILAAHAADPDPDPAQETGCWIGDGCLGQHPYRMHCELDVATSTALTGPQVDAVLRTAGVERLRAMVVALEQECAELTKLTATCTCTPYPAGDGPEADCSVHGAIRALNAANRECAALTDALGATTHDWQAPPIDMAHAYNQAGAIHDVDRPCWRCGLAATDPAHRTPSRVLAELEGQ